MDVSFRRCPFWGCFQLEAKQLVRNLRMGKEMEAAHLGLPNFRTCFLLIIFGTLDLKNPPVRKKAT